jgi:formylglycine-generating enzyme required for sulfatase activity
MAWRAAHPALEAEVTALKRATAELVAAHRAAERDKPLQEEAAAHAASAALTPQQKAETAELLARAGELLKSGAAEEAAAAYRKAAALDPANGDTHFGLGESLKKAGDLVGANVAYMQAARFPRFTRDVSGYFESMLAMQAMPLPPDPRLEAPTQLFRTGGVAELWDFPEAPRLTIIPAGEFTMGSLPSEPRHVANETPHRVSIDYPLAVGRADVTVGEFAAFVAETGYDAESAGASLYIDGNFLHTPDGNWRNPGFAQTEDEPVTCVSFFDSLAYAAWLSQKSGAKYRLPTEAEWEYAVRGGAATDYPWGQTLGLGNANCDGCYEREGPTRTTLAGAFPPNGFGLYDVVGNVWKWVADAWNNTYVGAPSDGSAWETGNCTLRGRRGGSWFNVHEARPGDFRAPYRLRSAARFGSLPHLRFSSFGMRLVREL